MAKFHSTMTRRDFMKAAGLVGAGAGAAAVAAPAFKDLDDLIASAPSVNKNPWWVKERDHFDPTVNIDWSLVKRYPFSNARRNNPVQSTNEKDWQNTGETYMTPEQLKAEADLLVATTKEKFPDWEPGPKNIGDIRYTALKYSSLFLAFSGLPSTIQSAGNNNGSVRIPIKQMYTNAGGADMFDTWLGVQTAPTPEDMGTPKWDGKDPEANLRMMRAVVRFFGGEDVGAIKIDDRIRKLFWTRTYDFGKKIVFNDSADKPYEDIDEYGIPKDCQWILTWTMRQPLEQNRRGAGTSDSAASYLSYVRGPLANIQIKEFLRCIGYYGLTQDNQQCGCGSTATLTGLGEHSRASYTNHPRYGITLRIAWGIPTNLPLPDTRPIDFGAFKFCKTCKICADNCPTGAISHDDPQYEHHTPGYPVKGFEGYHTNYAKCPHCPNCMAVCPFNTPSNGSFIHSIVKGTVATTSLFNGPFASMEKLFGYGMKDSNSWWDFDDYPWGVDTSY